METSLLRVSELPICCGLGFLSKEVKSTQLQIFLVNPSLTLKIQNNVWMQQAAASTKQQW